MTDTFVTEESKPTNAEVAQATPTREESIGADEVPKSPARAPPEPDLIEQNRVLREEVQGLKSTIAQMASQIGTLITQLNLIDFKTLGTVVAEHKATQEAAASEQTQTLRAASAAAPAPPDAPTSEPARAPETASASTPAEAGLTGQAAKTATPPPAGAPAAETPAPAGAPPHAPETAAKPAASTNVAVKATSPGRQLARGASEESAQPAAKAGRTESKSES
jgi:hypothetical protein